MRVNIAANFEGFEFGHQLEELLAADGHEVIWHGAEFYDEQDDYPLFALRVGLAVIDDEDNGLDTCGIVVGGSGTGEIIAANKVNGARAISAFSPEYVADARAHANANILVIGKDFTNLEEAQAMLKVFFETPFSRTLDDTRRLINTAEYESSKTIEGWKIHNWRPQL